MKHLTLAGLIGLTLASCANLQQAQTTFVQSCGAYDIAFKGAIQLREAGQLTSTDIDTITLLDKTITPICTGPIPTNPDTATTQVEAAVTQITVDILNQHASKK